MHTVLKKSIKLWWPCGQKKEVIDCLGRKKESWGSVSTSPEIQEFSGIFSGYLNLIACVTCVWEDMVDAHRTLALREK